MGECKLCALTSKLEIINANMGDIQERLSFCIQQFIFAIKDKDPKKMESVRVDIHTRTDAYLDLMVECNTLIMEGRVFINKGHRHEPHK